MLPDGSQMNKLMKQLTEQERIQSDYVEGEGGCSRQSAHSAAVGAAGVVQRSSFNSSIIINILILMRVFIRIDEL